MSDEADFSWRWTDTASTIVVQFLVVLGLAALLAMASCSPANAPRVITTTTTTMDPAMPMHHRTPHHRCVTADGYPVDTDPASARRAGIVCTTKSTDRNPLGGSK